MSFRIVSQWHLLIVSFMMMSCNGGASCPFERPSCCDNALFGCGPFDLPQGCSCGDYFSRSFSGGALRVHPKSGKRGELSSDGIWRVALERTSGGCSYLDDKINQTLLIRERNRKVVVTILGVSTLRGNRMNREAKVRGQFRTISPRCVAEMRGDLSMVSASSLNVSSFVSVVCKQKELSCTASYAGRAKRQ